MRARFKAKAHKCQNAYINCIALATRFYSISESRWCNSSATNLGRSQDQSPASKILLAKRLTTVIFSYMCSDMPRSIVHHPGWLAWGRAGIWFDYSCHRRGPTTDHQAIRSKCYVACWSLTACTTVTDGNVPSPPTCCPASSHESPPIPKEEWLGLGPASCAHPEPPVYKWHRTCLETARL